jgi:long-subunit fatty acid transport protein
LLSTSGTFPNVTRTAFSHYSDRVDVTFASFVYPIKNFTIGAYYHEPLKNQGAGEVVPTRNRFTGAVENDVPTFFLPSGGTSGPVSQQECEQIKQKANNDLACLQFLVNPFLTAVDVKQKTFGLAVAYKIGKFSFGATGRYQLFSETALTFRVNAITFEPQSIAVQTTARVNGSVLVPHEDKDITFTGGVKWAPTDKFSAGAVYKKGATFLAPTLVANGNTGADFVKLADTTFHIPDVYGVGVSYHPIAVVTLNADAVRVTYSNLVDHFVSNITDLGAAAPFTAADVTELHAGAEYFFSTKIPFAIRGGFWRDPAHSTTFSGPLTSSEAVGAALLYPKGQSQNHWSLGGGFAWPRFEIDFAYDSSPHYKVGSLSAVTRF